MARVLSIWLPQLPLDRLVRDGDSRLCGPFATTSDVGKATRLAHLNDFARDAGLVPGLPVVDARAICPDLLTESGNPLREASLLRALRRWADQLSPRVVLDGADGLLLDITGCAHLFGGEDAMAQEVRARLGDLQIGSRVGIADTKTAAKALSRFDNSPIAVAPIGNAATAIKSLPIAALDVPQRLVGELDQAGLKTIGQLFDIKPGEMARRFGLNLIQSLDAARGLTPDPMPPAVVEPFYSASMSLTEPIGYLDDLENVLRRLCKHLCKRLESAHLGARRFVLTVRCTDTGNHDLAVGFAKPCFAVKPVLRQFARPLGELKIEYGADRFRLQALDTECIHWHQHRLGSEAGRDDNLARAISTIGNRIGFDRIQKFTDRESHLPEKEFAVIAATDWNADCIWSKAPRRRPLRLFRRAERVRVLEPGRPPIHFAWRGIAYRSETVKGPERLTAEWWCDDDLRTRDYWIVQTDIGLRLWLLSHPGENKPKWFVAGRFP